MNVRADVRGTSRRSLRLVVALTAALFAVASCGLIPSGPKADSGSSGSAAPTASSTAAPATTAATSAATVNGAGMPFAPASYYEQKLKWKNCSDAGETFQCAKIKVPLDYRAPAKSIELALLKRPAEQKSDKVGSLVINPGGPGGSGVDYAKYASVVFSDGLVARYDIVGFDPRGVGQSVPVTCFNDRQIDSWLAMDGSPDNPTEVAKLVASSKAFGQACKANSGEVLGHVSTAESAADMDLIRAALGEEKLDFLGASYGTKLGATYAQEFPDRVGRFVLDGAMSPTATDDETSRTQSAGFETALDAFIADCVEDVCPLGNDAKAARAKLTKFLADLDERPMSTIGGRKLTQSLGEMGVFSTLYARDAWVMLRLALRAAFDGDASTLLALADQYAGRAGGKYDGSLLQANVAINCLDSGAPDVTVDEVEKRAAAYRKAAPIFGASSLWGALGCNEWPVTAQFPPPKLVAEGAPPIVVIGTTRDPATPYAWAEELASTLASGVLLTRDGDGHTGYNQGNECIDKAVDAFLIEGTVPDDGKRCA